MPASSDAWFYSNQLKIPTLTFGPGKLTDAHTSHEMISVADIKRASDILATFIKTYMQ
jgi:acetylornithine deacetylase/succinyl-diaminopimelate desuccinylase-like protein